MKRNRGDVGRAFGLDAKWRYFFPLSLSVSLAVSHALPFMTRLVKMGTAVHIRSVIRGPVGCRLRTRETLTGSLDCVVFVRGEKSDPSARPARSAREKKSRDRFFSERTRHSTRCANKPGRETLER